MTVLLSLILAQAPLMKGLILLSQTGQVQKDGVNDFDGIRTEAIEIPGGAEQLDYYLHPLFYNQPLNEATLQRLERQLILYYRGQGHPVVLVQIPDQDVTNGVVQVVIHESRLGEIRTTGESYFSSGLIKSYFRLKPNEPIDAFQLQNDLAWFNQSPFHHTEAVYAPGTQEWTTDLELMTTDRIPIRVYGGGDNTGVTDIGRARFFAGFDWGNVFGLNHILTFQGTTSADRKQFRAVTFDYKAPFPWKQALRLYGGYSRAEPNVPVRLTASGYSEQLSLRYELPFKPLYLGYQQGIVVGADYKKMNNTFEFSTGESIVSFGRPLQISQFVTAYTVGWEMGRHWIDMEVWLYWSPGRIFKYQSPGAYINERPHAKSKYLYEKIGFTWRYRFPSNCVISTQVRGQVANRNLVPSEQYGIGGYDTVRGYEERQFNADLAFIGNFEFKAPPFSPFSLCGLRKLDDQLTLLAFLDYGVGGSVQNVAGAVNHQYMIGIGPGLRYIMGRYLSARVDWGFKLHPIPGHGRQITHIGIILNY